MFGKRKTRKALKSLRMGRKVTAVAASPLAGAWFGKKIAKTLRR